LGRVRSKNFAKKMGGADLTLKGEIDSGQASPYF
jgi:hypothetical protein